jgi:hypothetical protein
MTPTIARLLRAWSGSGAGGPTLNEHRRETIPAAVSVSSETARKRQKNEEGG